MSFILSAFGFLIIIAKNETNYLPIVFGFGILISNCLIVPAFSFFFSGILENSTNSMHFYIILPFSPIVLQHNDPSKVNSIENDNYLWCFTSSYPIFHFSGK